MRPTRILVLALILISTGGDPVESPTEPWPDSIRLVDLIGDPHQVDGIVEVYRWTLGRYEAMGLELPAMTVTFHRERSNCWDFQGLWISGEDGMRVEICVGGEMKRRRILLHELAHAWLADNLDQADRDEFVARHGLAGWSGLHIEHDLQGVEHAAEVIVWGLDEVCRPSHWLSGMSDPTELVEEFELLTNRSPLCASQP